MNKILSAFLSLCLMLLVITAGAQETYYLRNKKSNNTNGNKDYLISDARDVVMDTGYFYDAGGEKGTAGNTYFISTIHAKEHFLKIYFEYFDIPVGASLKIFEGTDNTGKLYGEFKQGDNLFNVLLLADAITFEYFPTTNKSEDKSGWKALVFQVPTKDKKLLTTYPESDCAYAIPLCSNSTVQTVGQYTNFGATNDDQGSCFVSAFYGSASVWYSFYPQTNGPLDFSITPTGGADYDFVLYDITNGCASKQQISCNYSEFSGATGLSGVHCSDAEIVQFGNCSNNTCSTDSKTDDCNRWNRRVNVLTTHHYVLEITFYAGANYGFNLNFQNEAGSVAVTDNVPPTILNIGPSSCTSASTVHLDFSENILCSSIGDNPNEFSIPGYTVTVANTNCVSGHTTGVDLTIVPPLAPGTYTLTVSNITDICGNNMNQTVTINISPPTAEAGPHKYVCASRTLPTFGTAYNYTYNPTPTTLTASGGSTYLWSNGGNTQTISVTPTTTTVYWVTASIGSCTATDSTIVIVEGANAGPDQTICSGQSITLTSSPGVTYHWYSNPNVLFGTNGTSIATTQSITVAPTTNTNYRVIVTTAHGCTSTWDLRVTISASITPTFTALGPYCVGQTQGILPATSTNSISGIWNPSAINTAIAGTTVYTFTPATGSCATTATMSIIVNPGTVPTFVALGPYCVGDLPGMLPATSNNGISGTWSPSTVSTVTTGSTVYTFTPTSGSCGNGSMTIVVNPTAIPTFNALGPFCIGATPSALPTTSLNNITGTWSPATINTATAGTTVYTFTPNAGQCASAVTMSITIASSITANFTTLGPYCMGATPGILPVSSTNAISGSWNPSVISTATAGTAVYTFTPDVGQCATTTTMSVIVNANVTPTFTALGPYCEGATSDVLPITSIEGIAGTWNPAAISTTASGTTVYTFTPNAGLCATTTTMSVIVNANTTPTFTQAGPYCLGATVGILPSTSLNNITGTWNPATISTATAGTTVYTFTPTTGLCSTSVTMSITIASSITATFAALGPYCVGDTPVILPSTSVNNITGNWNPTTINTASAGVSVYTFTPDSGQCATTTTMSVAINANITPTFTTLGPYCMGDNPGVLPLTSNEGINGIWNPAAITTTTAGTAVYTFTPNTGQCATVGTMSVTVNTNATPVFTALGPYCMGDTPAILATTSNDGISGSWNPANISTATAGTAVYTFTPSAGQCASTTTMSVTINQSTTPLFTALGPYCVGDTPGVLTSTSTNGISGSWNPAAISTATAGNSVYNFTPAAGQCGMNTSMNIVINAPVVPNFTAIPVFCAGSIAPLLQNTSNNGITGTWNPSVIDNFNSGTYTFTPNAGQCATTQTLNTTVATNLSISVSPQEDTVCAGNSVPLVASGADFYQWSPSVSLSASSGNQVFASPVFTTIYTITGSSNAGCTGSTTATVLVSPVVPFSFFILPEEGCVPLMVNFGFDTNNAYIDQNTLLYNFDDAASGNNTSSSAYASHLYNNHGFYTVTLTATNIYGCPVSYSDTVKVYNLPVADFYAHPEEITINDPLVYFYDQSYNAATWNWSFGDPSSTNNNESVIQNPSHIYSDTGSYQIILVVSNGHNCFDTASRNIYILPQFAFWLPNSFTPDHNATNNTFYGKGMGFQKENFEMYVYDRWGKQMFSKTGYDETGWDGTYMNRGKKCEMGVYNYLIKITENNGIKHIYKGSIILIL